MTLTYELKTFKQDTSNCSPHYEWVLPIEEAKKIAKHLKSIETGSFWYTFYLRPIRQAIRSKKGSVSIFTSGFSNSDFQGILEEVAGGFENLIKVDRLAGFPDWLTKNYDYSGDVNNGRDNAWLSKSPADFNIYFESDLKKVYLLITQNG